MAKFTYIGTMVKDDGMVDARCMDRNGIVREWRNVIPNVTEIDVGEDPILIKCFENASDILGQYVYLRVN